jgi:hypothetical protein
MYLPSADQFTGIDDASLDDITVSVPVPVDDFS